mgnify:FL=1
MSNEIRINTDQRLFVIPCGSGYSCLGFDVERRQTAAIRAELGLPSSTLDAGTLEAYAEHVAAMEAARVSGRRLTCGLHPKLRGLEGHHVEATLYGERVRFWVGKSTGWIPSHLVIKTRRSRGGAAISPEQDLGDVVIVH